MKLTNRTVFYYLIILIVSMLSFNGQNLFAQATITETLQEMKTYPYFDPNPVANIGPIYPYFRFDGYSHKGELKKWKEVTLENPYIKAFVIPEIGGKTWGAIDKSTGRAFIYYNHVIKFRDLSLRGPYTSGGIEINFGIMGHAPTTASPVDYILKTNQDGSVSCVVSAMDLTSRTNWVVEIRLPKDKAYLETNILWDNTSGLHQTYYHWMTGSAAASDDLQFFYPGHSYIYHDGIPHPWPINKEGRDLSFYKNNNFGSYKPYHIIGEYSDYIGGYYHNNDFGFGHWSNYTDKPGRKLWIWGLSREGMIWENLLTDTDGQYIEYQTGRLFNQATFHSSLTPFKQREFVPYSTDTWKELWFPVKNTEGIKNITTYGILNIKESRNQLTIYFSPLQKIDDDLIVKSDGEVVYKKHISLIPLELFVDSLKWENGKEYKISVGKDKLRYSSTYYEDNYLHRPMVSPNFDWNSIQGLAIKAREEMKERKYDKALKSYKQCLEKDGNYIPSLIGAAELYYRRMDYDNALEYAKRALAINTYDGEANYIYGLINKELKYSADAKDGFSIAAQSVKYRSAAFTELAKMYIEEKEWEQAANFAQRAIDYNRYNLTAHKLLIICKRKQDIKEEANKVIEVLLRINPLSHFARFEKYILQNNNESLQEFNSLIRNEFPAETYLELAITYYDLGLKNEALAVLESAPVNPIVFYWRAYLLNQIGEKENSKDILEKAEKESAYLIFPFRTETVDVLEWALKNSNNWKSKYYLALIYWNKGKTEKAEKLFVDCKNEPNFVPFYLARGKFFESENKTSAALNDYKRATYMEKSNRRAWVMLSELYAKNRDYKNSLFAAKTIYEQKPNDYRVAIFYAQALYNNEQYKECLDVLAKTDVLPNEGLTGTRQIYNNANIMLAIQSIQQKKYDEALAWIDKSRLWPENLGAGKPYDTDEVVEDYLEKYIREQQGKKEKVAELNERINNQLKYYNRGGNIKNLMAVLILKNEGRDKEATELIEKWVEDRPLDDFARWVENSFKGDKKETKIKWEKIKNDPMYRMFFKEPIVHLNNNLNKNRKE